MDYPTPKALCVITNRPQRLQNVFDRWKVEGSVKICTQSEPGKEESDLLWMHRQHMYNARLSGESLCSCYMLCR